jgi:hypothetical protein
MIEKIFFSSRAHHRRERNDVAALAPRAHVATIESLDALFEVWKTAAM